MKSIIDNKNDSKKVFELLSDRTKEGNFNIVTGYFTVGALSYFSEKVNHKIKNFNFVLGDIVNTESIKDRTLDLLNENIAIDSALKLNRTARNAVTFLKQENVHAKTLEPNFCHAKAYIFENSVDPYSSYFIMGSSNLTEAGIGLKYTNNVELNIFRQGDSPEYDQLSEWFQDLWKCKQAHLEKTVNNKKINFKKYLIDQIEKIFIEYSPEELYYKVLFELFGEQINNDLENPNFNRQLGRLENTLVYKSLFEFQQKGILSLIKMLQKYNGAILADAVGLGKTWSALAVMKFFQIEGFEIIVLCPKKLEQNWRKFLPKQYSKFEDDKFDYTIRFHSDLQDDLLERKHDGLKIKEYFQSDRPKLIVIDESHNLRNDKSKRYNFLVETLLKKNDNVKVLMLSATPINNTLLDIRNQFKLITKGNVRGFSESLMIRNIDNTFARAQKTFNEWSQTDNKTINDFIQKLPHDFFNLTDSLIVARTRKMIEAQTSGLHFPVKEKPENIFVTPKQIGNFEDFNELFDHLPPRLSGYQPSNYIKQAADTDILHDEQQREFFLVKMMYILMVKRLESSWFSFMSTVEKIMLHHQNVLQKIKDYETLKKDKQLQVDPQLSMFEDEEDNNSLDDFTISKKEIRLSDIDKAGNLRKYKTHLKKDIESLDSIISNVKRFDSEIQKELEISDNHYSKDEKLEILINRIIRKQSSSKNNNNQKVVIFTVYKDTALYLFDQLKSRGFQRLAVVSGDISKTDDSENSYERKFEAILERFAPYTKLFREKEWSDFKPLVNSSLEDTYLQWKQWIYHNHPNTTEKLGKPIDILIATDVLSEGQNLQDADMVINYDIHWNPVRLIQRMGRVDRLGSINDSVFGINFWPTDNINTYLNLQNRIENKMAAMKLAGSEIDMHFTDGLKERVENEELEKQQKDKMLRQMETTWDDIEVSEQSLGFNDLSLEPFRQDLNMEINKTKDKYDSMPKGIYTGFQKDERVISKNGIIALLGYPSKPIKTENFIYKAHDLIYIDNNGDNILINQKEILDILAEHKDKERFVPESIDKGEEDSIRILSNSIKSWIKKQSVEEITDENGNKKVTMGKSALDILNKLKSGDMNALNKIKENTTVEEKYKVDNFDLIVWFLVS